jgi:hypothetical protein
MRVISPRGDYSARRDAARRAGAAVHLQFHFNSGGGAYSLTEITSAADARCRRLARLLAADGARIFGIANNGVNTLSPGERGWSCIGDELPGIINEPFFGDSPRQAAIARRSQALLADMIAARIRQVYPAKSVIALTLGHKYKTSNPSDRGADLAGGGNEASYMEPVLERTARNLTAKTYYTITVGLFSPATLVRILDTLARLHGARYDRKTSKEHPKDVDIADFHPAGQLHGMSVETLTLSPVSLSVAHELRRRIIWRCRVRPAKVRIL